MSKKILLVEDDPLTAKALAYSLEREKYVVTIAIDQITALDTLQQINFDLCLLDVGLPDGSGFEIAKFIQDAKLDLRIIFLTAREDELDRLRGLELGAVDYITKPFHAKEVLLKIRNLLKLNHPDSAIIRLGNLKIDQDSHQVFLNQQEVILSALEFRLLVILAEHPNKIVTRKTLADEIWQASGKVVNDNTISVYIKRIRQKLNAPEMIQTVKNLGYQLNIADLQKETLHGS